MALVAREHNEAGKSSTALYSPCGFYRYALTRAWDDSAPKLLYIMLNPSTATELKNDPTIERCERRAKALGFGAFKAMNLFAFRATDPKDLKRAREPIGPENLNEIMKAARWADTILCAWGTHGAYMGMGPALEALLRGEGFPLHHLGLSQGGHPRHPLYIAYDQVLQKW